MRHAKRKLGKAAGTDGLIGEIFRIMPAASSMALYPAMAKASWSLSVPLTMRGGSFLEIWKGRGSLLDCGYYRDVTIKDLAAKDVAAHWRSRIH